MDTLRQRKCSHCNQLFVSDPRQGKRQRYCVAERCRCASKAASQRRWLNRPVNRSYFCGPENVARVQAWRKANPDYAARARHRRAPLQETMKRQPTSAPAPEEKPAPPEPAPPPVALALQDSWRDQPPVLLGLIAHLIGSALQEEMAPMVRHLFTRGEALLGSNLKKYHDRKTSPLSGTRATSAAAF